LKEKDESIFKEVVKYAQSNGNTDDENKEHALVMYISNLCQHDNELKTLTESTLLPLAQ
jgi:hypothetical protein